MSKNKFFKLLTLITLLFSLNCIPIIKTLKKIEGGGVESFAIFCLLLLVRFYWVLVSPAGLGTKGISPAKVEPPYSSYAQKTPSPLSFQQ